MFVRRSLSKGIEKSKNWTHIILQHIMGSHQLYRFELFAKKTLGKHMPKANSLSSKSFMVLTVFQLCLFILMSFYCYSIWPIRTPFRFKSLGAVSERKCCVKSNCKLFASHLHMSSVTSAVIYSDVSIKSKFFFWTFYDILIYNLESLLVVQTSRPPWT